MTAMTSTWYGDGPETTTESMAAPRSPNFAPIRLGYFIGIGVIIPIGFVFNVLSIVVLVGSRQLRNSTTGLYLIALAVADTLFLIGEFLRWLDTDDHVPSYTFLVHSDVTCQFVFSLRYGAKLTSAWITVAITGERYVIVAFPLKAMTSCTRKLACTAIAVTYAVCFLLGCFPVFTVGLDLLYGEVQCLITDHVWYERGSWVVLRVGSLLLPGIIVIVLTSLIVINLSRATLARRRTLNEEHVTTVRSRSSRSSVESQLTAMLLAVALAFIVLRLPYTVLYYVNEYKETIWRPLDAFFSYRVYAATKVADLLATTNYAVNFFLYCLTGSTFRSQLRVVFRCNGGRSANRKSSTSATTHNTALSNEKLALASAHRNRDTISAHADHVTNSDDSKPNRTVAPPVGDNRKGGRRSGDFSQF